MTDDSKTGAAGTGMPSLEDWQHWTLVMGRAQQMLMQAWADSLDSSTQGPAVCRPARCRAWPAQRVRLQSRPLRRARTAADPMALMTAGAQAWAKGLEAWGKMLGGVTPAPTARRAQRSPLRRARMARQPALRHDPPDLSRSSPTSCSARSTRSRGSTTQTREKLRFATKSFVDAMSPSNFALTNPQVLKRTIETKGENLLKGLANMLNDIAAGQLTQTKPGAFEVGRNIATTPGKVIHADAALPADPVHADDRHGAGDAAGDLPAVDQPLLHPRPQAREKLRQMGVDQGVSLFMVSWKSADESIADVGLDDYVLRPDRRDRHHPRPARRRERPRHRLLRRRDHARRDARLSRRPRARRTRSSPRPSSPPRSISARPATSSCSSATRRWGCSSQLTADKGYLDGRYMAATFNLLRGRDLIWSYVVNNYLLGEDPPPFDLLHWNSDTTNLPANWHRAYLETLYRDNKLVERGGITRRRHADRPRARSRPRPTSRPAARTISPRRRACGRSWTTSPGAKRFVLAGSGHIAGVVNPPAAQKYQYWTNDKPCGTLDAFIDGATEHKGSWWPDWIEWLKAQDPKTVEAKGARMPGKGKLKAIEDAPGRYVKAR